MLEDIPVLDQGRFFKEIIAIQSAMIAEKLLIHKAAILEDLETPCSIEVSHAESEPTRVLIAPGMLTITYYNAEIRKLFVEHLTKNPESIDGVKRSIRTGVERLSSLIDCDVPVKLAINPTENVDAELGVPWITTITVDATAPTEEDTRDVWASKLIPLVSGYMACEETLVEILGLDKSMFAGETP